jgi:hypothetical protein
MAWTGRHVHGAGDTNSVQKNNLVEASLLYNPLAKQEKGSNGSEPAGAEIFTTVPRAFLLGASSLPGAMAIARARTAMQLQGCIFRQHEMPSDYGMANWPKCWEDMCRGRTTSTACLQHYCLSCQMLRIDAIGTSCQHC